MGKLKEERVKAYTDRGEQSGRSTVGEGKAGHYADLAKLFDEAFARDSVQPDPQLSPEERLLDVDSDPLHAMIRREEIERFGPLEPSSSPVEVSKPQRAGYICVDSLEGAELDALDHYPDTTLSEEEIPAAIGSDAKNHETDDMEAPSPRPEQAKTHCNYGHNSGRGTGIGGNANRPGRLPDRHGNRGKTNKTLK